MVGLAALVVLLAGCGDVAVEVAFDTLTTGSVRLTYEVLPEFRFLAGRAGVPRWPLTQADWTTLANRIQGLSVTGFTARDGMEALAVTVQLRFSNLQAIESLALELGQRLTVIGIQNVYTWTWTYQPPAVPSGTLSTLARLGLEGKSVRWTVNLPRPARETGRAQPTSGGRGFTAADPLPDILLGRVPELRVVW